MGAYTSVLTPTARDGAQQASTQAFSVTLEPREELPLSTKDKTKQQPKIEVEKIEVIHAVVKDWGVGSFGSFLSKLKQKDLVSETADVWAFKVSDYETRLAQALASSVPDKFHPQCINMLSVEHDKNNAIVYAVRERQDGFFLDLLTEPGSYISEEMIVKEVVRPLLEIVSDFYAHSLEVQRRGTTDWIKPSSLGYTIIDTQTRRAALVASTRTVCDRLADRPLDFPSGNTLYFMELPTEILYYFAKSHLHLPDAAKLAMTSKVSCASVWSLLSASNENFGPRRPSLRLVNCNMQDYVGYNLKSLPQPSCDFTITPEVLAFGISEQSYDMFCVASIVHILLCGHVHYHDCIPSGCVCNVHNLFEKITTGGRVFPGESWQHLSPECIDFLGKCLVLKTIPTLSAATALTSHPWLNGKASQRPIPANSFAKVAKYWRGYKQAWVDHEAPSFVPLGGPNGYVQKTPRGE